MVKKEVYEKVIRSIQPNRLEVYQLSKLTSLLQFDMSLTYPQQKNRLWNEAFHRWNWNGITINRAPTHNFLVVVSPELDDLFRDGVKDSLERGSVILKLEEGLIFSYNLKKQLMVSGNFVFSVDTGNFLEYNPNSIPRGSVKFLTDVPIHLSKYRGD